MRCHVCRRGETRPGETSVVLERDPAVIVIRGVPAEVCPDCGEYYLAADVSATVTRLADEAIARGPELQVLRYAA
jgi:YgiT-type zinc finger domain-containing protein